MPTFETTLIHLAPMQKKKLSQLAKRRHTSLASEVRNAIECYLTIGAEGIHADELAVAAKVARGAVEEMTAQAKRANRQLQSALRELQKPKSQAS